MGPWVTRLIVANVVMFLLAAPGTPLSRLLAFWPAGIVVRPWTILTYMFLHGSIGHLLFNMLALFFFGTRVEYRLGGRHFIGLYLLSGVFGAILSLFFTPNALIVGASGAVFGVSLAFAHFWPDERIYLWMVLPVPARVMVIGMTVISLFLGLSGRQSGVAHFAHLGGFVGGWLYLKWWERRRRGNWNPNPRPTTRFQTGAAEARQATKRWESIRPETLHEINRAEVERIQAKLRDGGYVSLSAGEKEYMDRMAGT